MVVMEPVFTEKENKSFHVKDIVTQLKKADHPKRVIAYVDIGQAEEWRIYWKDHWKIGQPGWIIGEDPDGWEGNYPVAYWNPEWKSIWLLKKEHLCLRSIMLLRKKT